MARIVQLSTLIEDTRRWANIRTSTPDDAHLTDSDVARVIELKLAEFHEILTSATGTAFQETVAAVAIVDGAGSLPDDFFRLNAAWVEWSTTDHESLRNLPAQQDATLFQGGTWQSGSAKAFRVVGSELRVYPPATTGTVQISYVPAFVSADEYDCVNGWEKYVTMGAALELMAIENRTNPKLELEYEKQDERIRSMAEERQAQDAVQVRDAEYTSIGYSSGSGSAAVSTPAPPFQASSITYDPTAYGLQSVTVQGAIDELAGYATMADLRAVTPVAGKVAFTKTYAATGDDGGGDWYAEIGSPGDYTHNGGTVLVPASGTGSDGSRAWRRKNATPVRPEWFGAIGDGSTDDTAAIDAASAWVASQGGGAVLFTAPSYAFTFTQPPYNVAWEFAGTDIGRDELGGSSAAVRFLSPRLTYIDGPHATEQYNAKHLRVIAKGSGALGAQYADTASSIQVEKENWSEASGTPEPGEINGMYIAVRQGTETSADPATKSGGAAILCDVACTADSGFSQVLEAVSAVVTKGTLVNERETRCQLLGIEDRVSPQSHGLYLLSVVGTQTSAHLVQGTTASRWTLLVNSVLDSISRFIISDVGRLRWKSSSSVDIEVSQEDATADLVFKDASSAEIYRIQQDKGRRAQPVVDLTTAITLDKRHSGRIVLCANAGGITATLDGTAPIGTTIRVIQRDAGQITFTAGSGATLRNRSTHTKTAGQYACVTLEVPSNSGGSAAIWYLSGDTAA